jgi:hypothetical protein
MCLMCTLIGSKNIFNGCRLLSSDSSINITAFNRWFLNFVPSGDLSLDRPQFTNQHENSSTTNNSERDEKLVKKNRYGSNRYSKRGLKSKSKQGLSKQSHSPVYE